MNKKKASLDPIRCFGVWYTYWREIPDYTVKLRLELEGWRPVSHGQRFGCCVTYRKAGATRFFFPEVPDRYFSGTELMQYLRDHWEPTNEEDQKWLDRYRQR